MVLDLAEAFERVCLPVVWAWATHFSFPRRIDLAGVVWIFRAPEASAVRGMWSGAAPDHHGCPARVEVELLMPAYCVAGRAE